MTYRVLLKRSAEKELSRLREPVHGRIVSRLLALKTEPRPPDLKKLRGGTNGYRLRVGEYRILLEIDDSARSVTVLAVGHRRDVYRRS